MIFSESPAAPGVPLVYRSVEDKTLNSSESLHLARYRQVIPNVSHNLGTPQEEIIGVSHTGRRR